MKCYPRRSNSVQYGNEPYHYCEIILDPKEEWIAGVYNDKAHLQRGLIHFWLTLEEYKCCFREE